MSGINTQQQVLRVKYTSAKGKVYKPATVIAHRYKGKVLQYKIWWEQLGHNHESTLWVNAAQCTVVEQPQPQKPTLWQRMVKLFGF